MTNQILNDVAELIELSDDELTEALLDEKYNKALLRELVRRSLKLAKDYRANCEHEREKTDLYRGLYNDARELMKKGNN